MPTAFGNICRSQWPPRSSRLLPLLLLACLARAGPSSPGERPVREELPQLTREDAQDTVVLVLVQGWKGCEDFPGFIRWFMNSTLRTPFAALDVVALDKVSLECLRDNEMPSMQGAAHFIRDIQDASMSASQVRAKSDDRGRRLWPSNLYQYMLWVAIEQRLAGRENVLHVDTDVVVLQDLWPVLMKAAKTADMLATTDCTEPGCTEFGFSWNPSVMFLRSTQPSMQLVSTILDRWQTEGLLDPTSHQMKESLQHAKIRDSRHLADITMLNKVLVASQCIVDEASHHAQSVAEFLGPRFSGGQQKTDRQWTCSSLGDLRLIPLNKKQFLRDKQCDSALQGYYQGSNWGNLCREAGVVLFHGQGTFYRELRDSAPMLPDPQTLAVLRSAYQKQIEHEEFILSTKVTCGGHRAAVCEDCPKGHGKDWCNGDCQWSQQGKEQGRCVAKNTPKPTNAQTAAPSASASMGKEDMHRWIVFFGVLCGGLSLIVAFCALKLWHEMHQESNANQVPQQQQRRKRPDDSSDDDGLWETNGKPSSPAVASASAGGARARVVGRRSTDTPSVTAKVEPTERDELVQGRSLTHRKEASLDDLE